MDIKFAIHGFRRRIADTQTDRVAHRLHYYVGDVLGSSAEDKEGPTAHAYAAPFGIESTQIEGAH